MQLPVAESLQLPAYIVALPVGLAFLARTVLWVRQVMTPITPPLVSGNGAGEWRGEIRMLLKQTLALAERADDTSGKTCQLLTQLGNQQQDIQELIERQLQITGQLVHVLERNGIQVPRP